MTAPNTSQSASSSVLPPATSADNQAQKVERLSPVLELIYVVLKNAAKYLKVYAEDVKVDELPEYTKALESLNQAQKGLEDIFFGLDTKAPEAVASTPPTPAVSQPQVAVPVSTPPAARPNVNQGAASQARGSAIPSPVPNAAEATNKLNQLRQDLEDKGASGQSQPDQPVVVPPIGR